MRRRRKRRREEEPCGTCIRGRGKKAGQGFFFWMGCRWEERTGPVTCGNHPHPVCLRFIIFLIHRHITRCLRPLLIPLLKRLQLLWARGKTEQAHGEEEREVFEGPGPATPTDPRERESESEGDRIMYRKRINLIFLTCIFERSRSGGRPRA